jgi:hypothetical protein
LEYVWRAGRSTGAENRSKRQEQRTRAEIRSRGQERRVEAEDRGGGQKHTLLTSFCSSLRSLLIPGEGGGKMNITSIIREDDDMEDEAIRNWDSSIDLKTLPMGRPAFDPPTKVDKERKERRGGASSEATATHRLSL